MPSETYAVGEIALATRQGKAWEARVLETRGDPPEYLVHYQGWNKKHDEWLDPTLLRKKATSTGAEEDDAKGDRKKTMRDDAGDGGKPAKKVKKESAGGAGVVANKGGKKSSGATKKKPAKTTTKSKAAAPATPLPPPPPPVNPEDVRLHVNLSTALKRELIGAWEKITREGKRHRLPKSVTVSDIVSRYESDAKARARSPEQGELISEVCAGLKAYFDRALHAVLLYEEEREVAAATSPRSPPLPPPSDVYGAEHLLRLFVKLPDLLPVHDMDAAAVREVQVKLTEFLRWAQRNASALFVASEWEEGEGGGGGGGARAEGKPGAATETATAAVEGKEDDAEEKERASERAREAVAVAAPAAEVVAA
jgi:mortality factor 4-like protein 1